MILDQRIILKNGNEAWLRNGDASDGKVVGMAGIEAVGTKYKVKHRAELGISILRDYWGLGLGRDLTEACIQCARDAGYEQLELNVIADNTRAVSMYKGLGFEEFGRNPRRILKLLAEETVVC